MCARRYTKTQHLLPVIEEMIATGKTHKEIERELCLEGDRPVHNLLKRERKKNSKVSVNSAAESRQKRCRNTSMKISD